MKDGSIEKSFLEYGRSNGFEDRISNLGNTGCSQPPLGGVAFGSFFKSFRRRPSSHICLWRQASLL
jgi:hypothetical protein